MAKVPCLHDAGLVVWDSLAIIEHLAERHEMVWPHDVAAKTYARSASSEMHAGFDSLRAAMSHDLFCSVSTSISVSGS